jgi:hypothetical protein
MTSSPDAISTCSARAPGWRPFIERHQGPRAPTKSSGRSCWCTGCGW